MESRGAGAESGPVHVGIRGAQGVQVGDQSTQINYFYNGTWTDGAAPPPLVSASGEIRFPYRGLRAFGEQDAALFFGREDAATAVLDLMSARLTGPGLAVVSGVSGAGKSSLLRAGVLPRLRGAGLASAPEAAAWPCVIFTASSGPLGELAVRVAGMTGVTAAALTRELAADPAGFARTARQASMAGLSGPAGPADEGQRRLIIVADQCEQLFTRCAERDRQAFITALYQAATTAQGDSQWPAALVVMVIRADAEARLAEYRPDEYPLLAQAVQDRYLLTSMTERQLRMAITEPAALAGSSVDGELTAVLLAETGAPAGLDPAGQAAAAGAGVLPLLSYALDQSWRHRTGQTLTLADYERTGGIQGAVAASAQGAYDRLTPAQQDIARRVFIRLTATSDDGLDTITRVARADLTSGLDQDQVADVATVIETFAAERLLTLAAGTAEISHEALLTAWPLLRDDWLAQTREDRLIRTRLTATAQEWAHAARDPSYLYSGSRLEAAREAAGRIDAGRRHVPLSQAEREFLDASHRAARRRTRRGQGLIALLLVLATVLAVVAVAAISASQASSHQRDIAVSQRDIAISTVLADRSQSVGETDVTLAQHESLAAWAAAPTPAARWAMTVAAASPETATFSGDSGIVNAVAFSPDRRMLATASDDGSVRLWNLATERQTIVVPPSGNRVYCEAFSPDGKVLATGDFNGNVRLWNPVTGREIRSIYAGGPSGGSVNTVAFSPDGTTLAAGNDSDGTVRLWDRVTGRPAASLATGTKDIASVVFGPDGTLAAAAGDGSARIWNIATQRQIHVLPAGGGPVFFMRLALSPDGTILATGGNNGIRLWNTATGHLIDRIRLIGLGPIPVAFSPDGRTLAAGGLKGQTGLWNVATGQLTGIFSAPGSNITKVQSVAFSPDGRTLATGNSDDTARLWDLSIVQPARSIPTGLGSGTGQMAFGSHGTTLVTSDFVKQNGAARLWNAANGRLIHTFPFDWIHTVALSRDGMMLAVGGSNLASGAAVWNVSTGRLIHRFPGGSPEASIESMAFSPDGRTLAMVDDVSRLHLWNLAANRQILMFAPKSTLNSVAFSPDGRTLALGEGDGAVHLWNVAARRQTHIYSTHSADTYGVAFSPDGSRLAVGDSTGNVWVWNLSTGKRADHLFTGSAGGGPVAFSPDGRTLAAPGREGAIGLWNLATGLQIASLGVANGALTNSMAFSPDGRTLAVELGGAAQLWDVSYLRDPLARVCALTGGTFTRAEWNQVKVPPGPAYHNVCAGTS